MNLSLAFSTCPNDTFIFDALVNKRISAQGYSFDTHLADIQELNTLALEAMPDVVKISFALYPLIAKNYQLLNSGSALGEGVGPLVISKKKIYPDEVAHAKVGIPGVHTTANMLFTLAYPNTENKRVLLFSDMEEALLENEIDVGVIIHENRFTYQDKGLRLIKDLGDFWEEQTGLPIPLGGIAIRRSLPQQVKAEMDSLLRRSVEYAFANPDASEPYVKNFAQAMEPDVMRKHINLYVNQFSVSIGDTGRKAVSVLFNRAATAGYPSFNPNSYPIFV